MLRKNFLLLLLYVLSPFVKFSSHTTWCICHKTQPFSVLYRLLLCSDELVLSSMQHMSARCFRNRWENNWRSCSDLQRRNLLNANIPAAFLFLYTRNLCFIYSRTEMTDRLISCLTKQDHVKIVGHKTTVYASSGDRNSVWQSNWVRQNRLIHPTKTASTFPVSHFPRVEQECSQHPNAEK